MAITSQSIVLMKTQEKLNRDFMEKLEEEKFGG